MKLEMLIALFLNKNLKKIQAKIDKKSNGE